MHGLIEEHAERTDSPVAARILAGWAEYLPLFKKVMPHDYKRALTELASESETVYYHDDHPTSSHGEGFVTTESESPEPAETAA